MEGNRPCRPLVRTLLDRRLSVARAEVILELKKKGHKVVVDEPWSHGRCLAILNHADTGVISGGASPRGMKAYAMGW